MSGRAQTGGEVAAAKSWHERVDVDLLPLLPELLENLRADTAKLTELLGAQDYAALARLGHNYKGSSAYFASEELGRVARSLELAAKDLDATSSAAAINVWQRLVQALRLPDEP